MEIIRKTGNKQAMMKNCTLAILMLFAVLSSNAQSDEEKLSVTVKEFHQALVSKNTVSINQQTDKVLSYGHSNGWVETKTDMIRNLETGVLAYKSYKEDSLQVMINGNMANVWFVAAINVTMNGKDGSYQLKVLEVWVRKGKRWVLFARQAVRS